MLLQYIFPSSIQSCSPSHSVRRIEAGAQASPAACQDHSLPQHTADDKSCMRLSKRAETDIIAIKAARGGKGGRDSSRPNAILLKEGQPFNRICALIDPSAQFTILLHSERASGLLRRLRTAQTPIIQQAERQDGLRDSNSGPAHLKDSHVVALPDPLFFFSFFLSTGGKPSLTARAARATRAICHG